MDESRFDRLVVSLTTTGSRRRALGGLLAGALGVLGWQDSKEAIAHNLKATCRKKSGDAKKKCLKKARKHAAQHASETPPGCVPEPASTTCAGRCGTAANNCGQAVTCPSCPTGQTCLINGTCARLCTAAGAECTGCTSPVSCSIPSTEGQQICVISEQQCVERQPCDPPHTMGCPVGQACFFTCSGTHRCFAVASCPAR
jgi:hypothetical protein